MKYLLSMRFFAGKHGIKIYVHCNITVTHVIPRWENTCSNVNDKKVELRPWLPLLGILSTYC